MLMNIINKAAHVGLGAYSAWGINNPDKRAGAIALIGIFGGYQLVEKWSKGDEAYKEIKEFAIGHFGMLALIRTMEWLSNGHSAKPKRRVKRKNTKS